MKRLLPCLLLALLLWLGGRPGQAQPLLPVWAAGRIGATAAPQPLMDSLAALVRYLRVTTPEEVERTTTSLLGHYPRPHQAYFVTFPLTGFRPSAFLDFRLPLYAYRAEARARLGRYPEAEADLTAALALGEAHAAYPRPDWLAHYQDGAWSFLRTIYFYRAQLRLDYLRDPAGGCADLARSYQLDTVRAADPRWRRCPLPRARVPTGPVQAAAAQAMYHDSLTAAATLLRTGRAAAAETRLRRLATGQVGPYVRVRPLGESAAGPDDEQVALLLSEAARQQGHYPQGRDYLEQLLTQTSPPRPALRYRLGRFKIDYLGDSAGGCQDLRWVYDHDTTRTSPQHPRWRGCSLPAGKNPVGETERRAYQQAFADSLAYARSGLVDTSQLATSIQVVTRLLRTHAAGRFVHLPNHNPAARLAVAHDYGLPLAEAYLLRAELAGRQRQYAPAVAYLDTLLRDYYPDAPARALCLRGSYRVEFLHEAAGCDDLRQCFERTDQPPGQQWHGCPQQRWARQKRWRDFSLPDWLEDRDVYPVVQVGLFRQGTLTGGQVSYLLANTRTFGESLAGFAPGLDLGVGPDGTLLAPRLTLEAVPGLPSRYGTTPGPFVGRLDLSYCLNQELAGELRLMPHLGLSVGGLLNLTYGYGFHLAGTELSGLSRHRITFSVSLLEVGKLGG